jgi:hypothetical protein
MIRPLRLCLLAILLVSAITVAQGPSEQPDLTIDAAMRAQVIDGVVERLNKLYVFPEVAKKMEEAIRGRQHKGEYDKITSAAALSKMLTSHLQEVSHDKHLRVSYSFEARPVRKDSPERDPEERKQFLEFARFVNFGFEKVERLSGNVGYLDLRAFMGADVAGETAVAAMNFLANTNALIIDLRNNGGGNPDMVALVSSYLFDSDPVHLNDLYWRPENTTHQWWTLPYVPGTRYAGKPVYVLTSRRTFSAGEEFTYNLQNLKRATIVGETTGGGAHPGGGHPINEHFVVWVPTGRAINPISKTNWEGTGVKPDIEVPAYLALKTAHLEALKKLQQTQTTPRFRDGIARSIQALEKELDELRKAPPPPQSEPRP